MKINDITLTEQQLDELGWKDIQRGAKKVAKGAEKFTKNVNDTGNALGGAANAIGGAAKAVGNQFVAKPVAGAYNAVKGGLQGATNVVKNVGTDVGNAAKTVGQGVAKAVGGTAGAVGAVAGGATTGVGRAAAGGFNTGAQAVGGDAKDPLASVFKQPGDTAQAQAPQAQATSQGQGQAQGASQAQDAGADVAAIQSQIKQKQDEIQDLQTQLSQATTAARSATNTKTTQTKTTKQEPEDEENGIAKAIKAVDQAWQKGARPLGGAWGSVADTGKPEQKGIEGYTKTTDGQWLDKETNQPVADKKLLKVLNQQDKANAQAPQPAATTKQDTTAQATQAPAAAPAPTAAPATVAQKPAADELGRFEPTMEPATAQAPAAAKPAAPNFSNQLAGGKQNISVGGTFNPATMTNVAGPSVKPAIPNTRIPQPMNAMTPGTAAPAATTKKPAATVNASKINKSKGIDLAEALWKTIK